MRAAVITEPGDPDVFALQELPDPEPGPEDVLVAVHATALNRADLMQRRGGYPAPPGIRQDVPGLEMSGVVERVGERVTQWSPGDRVMALLALPIAREVAPRRCSAAAATPRWSRSPSAS